MGELWRDLVETLRRRPALWLPVLIADLIGYLLNLGRVGLLHAIILHNSAQQSVFGGSVVHVSMSPSAVEGTTIAAVLLTWGTYFLRLLLYSGAFVATAALVQAYLERAKKPVTMVAPALAQYRGGILELALRGLAVYAVAALAMSWLTPFLAHHGGTATLRSPWFNFGVTLLILLTLAALLAPPALRVLAGRSPGKDMARRAQLFAFSLVLVAALVAMFVLANSRELAQVPAGARYPLEAIGSLLGALPYVLLFTGIALLGRRLAREESEYSPGD